ncbi:MAG: tetratricopeptide repeat protein [Polyangiaceae bacterium]|nr:tetratricopeptide repeat protein [Polyangiaceae bacterium]
MSTDREKIIQAAQKWVDKKRYDRAVEEYQKIVAQDPNDARTLLKIGDLQARMQAYPEAIATYDRVGEYYASQGFALKAIAVYKQIRELIRKHAPHLADRYGHLVPRLAEIYTQLGLTSDALQAYDEVATRLQRGGRDRDAIDIFRKMVELDASNPLPHLRLAEACCRVQALDDAIDAFWTAAELLLQLGRRDDALKVIERILHFKAQPRFAKVAAELYLQRGTREDGLQALAKLQLCFQADPKDLETLSLLAQAFTLIDQPEKSIEVYKEMARIARDGNQMDLFRELVAHLVAVAPNDEQVRALSQAEAPEPEPVHEPSAVHVDDADVELMDDDGAIASEEPFELRPSHPEMRPFRGSSPDVVVVDDQVEVAEELVDPDSLDARAHARKAVIDAESFRRLRLYSKALEVIHIALEIDPGSTEVREKLREILIESGDRDGAIGESITLAAIHAEQGDPARAEVLLYEVLEAEPNHAAALEMLAALTGEATQADYAWNPDEGGYAEQQYADQGYEYGEQQQYADQQQGYDQYQGYEYPEQSYDPYAGQTSPDGYDPNAPLPSYDLEEVSASSAMASAEPFTEDQGYPPTQDPFASASMDEPFVEGPLPSFPLGTEAVAEVDEEEIAYGPEAPTSQGLLQEETSTEPTSGQGSEAVEEALEEAEFFGARGLYDDARAIISDQLARTPNHPLLIERLREIDGAIAAAGESRTIDRSQLEPAAMPAATEQDDGDRAFDIAASLEALDQLEPADAPPAQSIGGDDIDVDHVFAKFKEGVRAQVAENDSATHYDLGVAYKEMGLLGDAISEFELAAKDPSRDCMCYAMIGMIRLERTELDDAAKAYIRALESPHKTVEQEMALYYDLGNVYEMKSSPKEALYYFQKIARRDPGYRDVSDRIAALSPESQARESSARAVNDDDEFDRVFDDLFESK